MKGKKTFYAKCKYCGSIGECYEQEDIADKDTNLRKKGQIIHVIRCKRLDRINLEVASKVNKAMSKLFFK